MAEERRRGRRLEAVEGQVGRRIAGRERERERE